MEKKLKRKSRFKLLLMTEKEDGTIKRRMISSVVVEAAAAMFFLLAVVIICKLVYDTITLRNVRKELIDQTAVINDLTDENEALAMENSTLSSKVAVLSETVSKKAATEDEISQEAIENALPKGFPLSGSATMKEDSEGEPMLIFKASMGTNVITTGTGTVISVDADEVYGTKIVVDHGNGYKSVYRNRGASLIKSGEELGKGYILFSIGEDNQELGYQIMQDDEYIDPMIMIEISG